MSRFCPTEPELTNKRSTMDGNRNRFSHDNERYCRNFTNREGHPRHRPNWQQGDDEFYRSWNNSHRSQNRFGSNSYYNQYNFNSRRYHETPWQNGDYRRMVIKNVYKVDSPGERYTESHDHQEQHLGKQRSPSTSPWSWNKTPHDGRKKMSRLEKSPESNRTRVTVHKQKRSPVSTKGKATSLSHRKLVNLDKKPEKKPSAKVCPTVSRIIKKPAIKKSVTVSPSKLLSRTSQPDNLASSPFSGTMSSAKAKPVHGRLNLSGKINEALNKSSLLRIINDPRSRRSRYKLAEMVRNHSKAPSKRSVSVANLQLSDMFEESPDTTGVIQLEKLPSEIQQEIANLTVNKSTGDHKDLLRVKSTDVKSPVNHLHIDKVNPTSDPINLNSMANNSLLSDDHRNRTEGEASYDEELQKLLSVIDKNKEIKTEKTDLYEGANFSNCFTSGQIRLQNTQNQGFPKPFCGSSKGRPAEKTRLSSEPGPTWQLDPIIKSEPTSDVLLCNPQCNDVILQQMSYNCVQSTVPFTSTESNIADDINYAQLSIQTRNFASAGKVPEESVTISTTKSSSSTCTSVISDATICQSNSNGNLNASGFSSSAQMFVPTSSLSQPNKKSISVNPPQKTSSSLSIVPETSLPIRLSSELLTCQKIQTTESFETEKSRWVSKATTTASPKTGNTSTTTAVLPRHDPVLSTNFSASATNSKDHHIKELLARGNLASQKNSSTLLLGPCSTQPSNPQTSGGIPVLKMSESSSQSLQSTLQTEILESTSTVQAITMPILSPSTTAGKKRKEPKTKSSARSLAMEQSNESTSNQTKTNGRKSTELGTMNNVNKVLQLSMREETVRQNVTAINIKLASVQKSILKYQIQLAVLEQNKAQLLKEEEALRSERMSILQNVVSNSGGSLPITEAESADTSLIASNDSFLAVNNSSWITRKKRRPRAPPKHKTVDNISQRDNLAPLAYDNSLANTQINLAVNQFERTSSTPESLETTRITFPCAEQITQSVAENIPRRAENDSFQNYDSEIQECQSTRDSISGKNGAVQNSSFVSSSNNRKITAADAREKINRLSNTSRTATVTAASESTAPEYVPNSVVRSQGQWTKKGCVKKRRRKKDLNVSPHVTAGAVIVEKTLGIRTDQLPGFCMEYIGTLKPGDDEKTIIAKLASGVIETQISEVKRALASRTCGDTNLSVPVDINTSAVSLREAEQSTSGMDFSYFSDDPKSKEFFLSCLSQSGCTGELTRNEVQRQENILPFPSSPIQDCFVSLGKRTDCFASETRKKLKSKAKKQQTDHNKMKTKKVKKQKKKRAKVPISDSVNIKSYDPSYAKNTIVQESGNIVDQVPRNSIVQVGAWEHHSTLFNGNIIQENGNTTLQEPLKKFKEAKNVNNRSNVSKPSVKDVNVKHLTVDSAEERKKSVASGSAFVLEETDSLPDLDGVHIPDVNNSTDEKVSLPRKTPEKRKKLRTRKERGVKQLYTVGSSSDNPADNSFLLADKISTSLAKPEMCLHSKSSLNDTPDAKENDVSVNTVKTDNKEIDDRCSDSKRIKSETEQVLDRNENVKGEIEILSEDDRPLIRLVESSQFKGPDLNVTDIQVYKDHIYVCYGGCVARKFNPETTDKRCIMEYKTDSIQTENMIVTNKGSRSNEDRVFLGGSGKTLVSFHEKSGLKDGCYIFGGKILCLHNRWGHIFIGLANGGVLVFDLKKNISTGAYRCANKGVCSITSATEGVRKVICVGSQDSSISVFDASSGMMLRTLGGHDGFLMTLKTFRGFLYSGSSNGRVLVHNINTGELVTILCRKGGFISCLNLITVDDTPYLLTGSYNKLISCYDLQTKSLKQMYYGAGYSFINSMAKYQNKIITGNKEGLVEAVALNPNQNWTCKADGCSYVFGLQDHRNHHMKEDHYLVPCSWKTCDMWLSNENEQIIADHMTRHLIQS